MPTIRGLSSLDLPNHELPSDPSDCSVLIEAEIGAIGVPGADIFSFEVVTRAYLLREELPRWGRGLLLVEQFSWEAVEASLQKLLMHAARPAWEQVATELGKELHWEFENYTET